MGGEALVATPTRVLPVFFLMTFLAEVPAVAIGGADHDTPAPAGSTWFVAERRSEWLLLLLLSTSLIALTLPALEMADGGDDKKENPDVDGDGNVGMELG